MTTAQQFCAILEEAGFTFASGVPCTILASIITQFSHDSGIKYIPATREDEALGLATGAYLAGEKPVVLMQNSGLGNSINALASLDILYQIPILMIISWRGFQGNDAPEHLVMGRSTVELLNDIGVPVRVLTNENIHDSMLSAVNEMLQKKTPVALILQKGIVSEET